MPSTGDRENAADDADTAQSQGRVGEVVRVFLRLGLTAFGGPAAHIAAMEDELVRRRGWVSRAEFVDLLSASNVIPGPNSTELAIHLGYRRAGWRGLVLAGLSFVGPATAIVWIIAMGYSHYGRRPEVSTLLAGMQPVVLAVVVQALSRLMRNVLRTSVLIGIAVFAIGAVLAGVHELLVLLGAALAGVLAVRRVGPPAGVSAILAATATPTEAATSTSSAVATSVATTSVAAALLAGAAPTALGVFGAFLKIGSVLFGSGYVLLAFLRAEFVERHGWLSEAQLLDAIAVGQVTPGPVFSSATFIGYLLAGHAGAAAATVGIFLPAFLFVAISGPLVRRIRQSPRAAAALDGVNAGSLALMAGVVLLMLRPVATSAVGLGIFLVASVVLLRTRVSAGWMLLAGAMAGVLRLLVA